MTEFQGQTPRGFGYSEFRPHLGSGMPLTVQESSLATARCLWIGVEGWARSHLDEDVVRDLRDLLTSWLGDGESESDSDERECSRCGDTVQILNARDECMGCEEERATPGRVCISCDETIPDCEQGFRWRDECQICSGCAHDAHRSGWEGDDGSEHPHGF